MTQPDRRKNADTDRYFNAQFEASPLDIAPGEAACSDADDEMLVATVGEGVVVSFFEKELMLGALAYVSLPPDILEVFPNFKSAKDEKLKKAFVPLDNAIAQLKEKGAGKTRIQVRVMGGADLTKQTPDSGTKNTVFVKEYINRMGLSILNEDIGGPYIRRVHFFPTTGRAVRILLKRESDYSYVRELEDEFHQNIA